MIKLLDILFEAIKAEEAYTDLGSIQTIIDSKRDVGAISFSSMNKDVATYVNELIEKHNLKILKIPSNPGKTYIVYKPEAEKQARELLNIAEKYGGYLSFGATEEDSRRIGQLLGYVDEDIEDYIKSNRQLRNQP